MHYCRVFGVALASCLASEAAAQADRSAPCVTAREHLTEARGISREMMQAPLAGIEAASERAAELPDEQQTGAIEVLDIIITASLEGLEERNGRFADNLDALASIFDELCGDDWPDEAPVPPEETPALTDESE